MIFTRAIIEGDRRVRGKMASEVGEEKNQPCLIPSIAGWSFFTLFHSHRKSYSSECDTPGRLNQTCWLDSFAAKKAERGRQSPTGLGG